MNKKATIIGLGNVGRAILRDLLNAKLFNVINCIDPNETVLEGMIMDFQDKSTNTLIDAEGYEGCRDSDIIIITAGLGQKPGETRLDLGKKNYGLMKGICKNIMDTGFDGIIIVVSNPVDILTTMVYELTGLPAHKVIGSGTVLDTGRLKYLLSTVYQINPSSIHAYVVGEHGDSEFVLWDTANIAGVKLILDESTKKTIRDKVANKAYEIINRQGYTAEGIGSATCKICEAIMRNKNSVLTVSIPSKDFSDNYIAVSYPRVVGLLGARKMPFNNKEDIEAMTEVATKLRAFYDELNEDTKENN